MAKHFTAEQLAKMREKLLDASAELFLTQGFAETSMMQISEKSGVDKNTLIRIFSSKENILAALVKFVLEEQFAKTKEFIKGKTEDKILYYAAETTLQLYIVESHEHIRELYAAAYSLPVTTRIIQQTITEKLEIIFKEHLPHLATTDFYMLEIASGGIMRGFMTIPCNMWFTIEKKVKAFLEASLTLYKVPDEKINEAVEFVSQFDFKRIAEETIAALLAKVAEKA